MADWMAQLPPALHCVPINYLLLPGTNHSGAYRLLQKRRRDRLLGKRKATRLLVQGLDIEDQLLHGARALELCIGFDTDTYTFYLTKDNRLCLDADEALQMVASFIAFHPGEVVLLRIVSKLETALLQRFLNDAVDRLEPLLIVRQALSNVTLSAVYKTSRRLLLCYDGVCTLPQVWCLPWLDSTDADIDEFLQTTHALVNSGHRLVNLRLDAPEQRKLLDNGAVGLSQINIISTDFMNDQFIQWVIDYNLRFGTVEGASIKL